MADVEVLPLPDWGGAQVIPDDLIRDYARANVEHHTEALRAEVERLQRQLRQTHKDYGCELRDPNGTIWEYAAAQKARVEQLEEVLRGLLEKLRGTGMAPLARIRTSAALLRKQEEGRD